MDALMYRQLMGQFATGIAVVTARDAGDKAVGMTVNSFSSLSLEPPLVQWCLGRDADHFDTFLKSDYYAVNILSANQEKLSNQFAVLSEAPFSSVEHTLGAHGLPLLSGCLGVIQCRVVARHDGGDHLIMVGEVLEAEHHVGEPLLYFGGQYRQLSPL